MAFRANVFIEDDVLRELKEAARSAPREMRRELGKIARGPRAQQLIARLSREPGRPNYPLRWKSAKQRRYVMALLRQANNLPYTRTHRLSQGWRVVLESIGQDERGVIRAENSAPEARYVQGTDQQPYHIDTGWVAAEPAIRAASSGFESDVISAWHRVVSR